MAPATFTTPVVPQLLPQLPQLINILISPQVIPSTMTNPLPPPAATPAATVTPFEAENTETHNRHHSQKTAWNFHGPVHTWHAERSQKSREKKTKCISKISQPQKSKSETFPTIEALLADYEAGKPISVDPEFLYKANSWVGKRHQSEVKKFQKFTQEATKSPKK